MTRPPWWTAHAVGLVLVHAAFWFGYWRLSTDEPFSRAIAEATAGPAEEMVVLLAPLTVSVALLAGCSALIAIHCQGRGRMAWTILTYAIVAGYWCLAADFRATPLDL